MGNTKFPKTYGNIELEACKIPSWYMQGNGSFAAHAKTENTKDRPKRTFRFVDTGRPRNAKTGLPLPTYGVGGKTNINEPLKQSALVNSQEALQQALYADAVHAANEVNLSQEAQGIGSSNSRFRIAPVDLIGHDYDEAQMEDIFRKRRKQIDNLVENALSQEVVKNFMRPIPFALAEQNVRVMEPGEHDKTFLTQNDGQADAETFFAKFSEEELLQTPRTPRELRQQQALVDQQLKRRDDCRAIVDRPPAVDVPIDVRRSLEALRDAMNRGDDVV